MVMDEDDPSLIFIAGVYAYALRNGGRVTPKQAKTTNRITERISDAWYADELECCQHDLESMSVGGHA